MEALSVLVFEERQRKRFHAELDHHQAEFKRNIRSLKAIEHVKHLDQSRVTGNQLLNEFQERVVEVLTTLSLQATIIEIDPVALKDALGWRRTVIEDPTDGLILRCITGHSRSNPSVPKAFVSFNFNDFGQESVGKKLDEAGIKYFKEVRNALGWLRSRIPSQTDV